MSATGAALEAAVKKGGKYYELTKRAHIKKQITPMSRGGIYTGTAPLDFEGWTLDKRDNKAPVFIECKSTGLQRLDFANSRGIEQPQLDEIRKHVADKEQVWIIVEMSILPEHRVFRVDGRRLVEFADAPWRNSLSLDWLKDYGEVCRETDRGNPRRHSVRWLDVYLHPDRAAAVRHVAEDKAGADGAIVELYPQSRPNQGAAALDLRDMLATKPKRDASDAEHLAWRKRFAEWMDDRNYREAKRVAARKPKRGGRRG